MRLVLEGEARITDPLDGYLTRPEDVVLRIDHENRPDARIVVSLNGHALKMSTGEARNLASSLDGLAGPAVPAEESVEARKLAALVKTLGLSLDLLEGLYDVGNLDVVDIPTLVKLARQIIIKERS